MRRTLPALMALMLLLPACGAGAAPDSQPPAANDPGSIPPPNPQEETPGPVGGIEKLIARLGALRDEDAIDDGTHAQLVGPLERARLYLLRAEPEDADLVMKDFQDRLKDPALEGALDGVDTEALVAQSVSVTDQILTLALPVPPGAACAGVLPILYVDARAMPGGDGSAAFPLPTITAAFDAAAVAALSGVEIQLALGTYVEHLEITRDTRIVGEFALLFLPVLVGSIHNTGAHCLEITSLQITDARSGPAGALYVAHPAARTLLNGIIIRDARAFGIYQHGGELTVEACIVDSTDPLASPVGVAMRLSGGVHAHLQNVWLTDNDGGGLVVRDEGTSVLAERLRIERTQINSYARDPRPGSAADQLEDLGLRSPFTPPTLDVPPGRAGLDVREKARFVGRVVSVADSEYAGIYVETSADVDLQYAFVGRTRAVIEIPDGEAGIGAWARLGGALRMQFFAVEEADLCGFMVGPGGTVDLMHGVVRRCLFGACILDAGFDPLRLSHDVRYQDNASNLQASFSQLVPAPADGIDGI